MQYQRPLRTNTVRPPTAGGRPKKDVDPTILLSLDAAGWTIAFTDCPEVVDGLEAILQGWRIRRLDSSARQKFDAHVTRTAGGYGWRSEALPKPALWNR